MIGTNLAPDNYGVVKQQDAQRAGSSCPNTLVLHDAGPARDPEHSTTISERTSAGGGRSAAGSRTPLPSPTRITNFPMLGYVIRRLVYTIQ